MTQPRTVTLVAGQLRRLLYRAGFYLDVPGLIQLLKFRQLRGRFYADLWQQTAVNIGAVCRGWDAGFMRIERDGLTTIVHQSTVMLDDQLTLEIMGNKALVYQLMSGKGYAVPNHLVFSVSEFDLCRDFFLAQARPVVLKPAGGTGGGRGVTTGIRTLRALRKAFRLAARFDSRLIVEEQLDGHSYRLLYIDGRFVDAVRRDAPVIVGDGTHTIRQLVAMENVRRLEGKPVTALSPLKIDRDCQNRLKEMGLRPRDRLEAGRVIELKKAINENTREQNHRVSSEVHADTVRAGAALVRDLGVAFAGLDVICKDISKPLSADNGLISEINTTPGIHHHYLVSGPAAERPIADQVLDHIFQSRTGTMALAPALQDPQEPADRHDRSFIRQVGT